MNPSEKVYYNHIKNDFTAEYNNYVKEHPEIKQLLSDYMSSLLMEKPNNVINFTKEYFSYYNKSNNKINNMDNLIKPLIISGPSGCGKGTIIKYLLEKYNCMRLSVSHTTRKMREGETNGKEYNFITEPEFKELINKNEFIEYVTYNNNYYGTHISELTKSSKENKIVILDIELKGLVKIFKSGISCNYIYMYPPSIDALRERLIKRGTEDIEMIEKRINISKRELEEVKDLTFIDHKLENNDLETFKKDIETVVTALYPELLK